MATRPYQGYPCSNPYVIDAPTVDTATASRWNNLPRRPIQPPGENVIYVDLPEEGSQVSRPNGPQSDKMEPAPVIYIDVPDSGSNDIAGPASPDPQPVHYCSQHNTPSSSDKKDPDPVIYIDVPDSSSSELAGPASPEPEPEYVQETIFYDPFENRRIDRQKADEPASPSGTGLQRRPAPPAPRPTPPRTLDLHGASGSSGYPSAFSSPGLAASLREPSLDDRFRPIPVTPYEYPEPPPAYSEIHTPHTPQTPAVTPHQTPAPDTTQEPPRTVVITPGAGLNRQPSGELPSPIGLASDDRKVVFCHHCGLRVHTLVIWQSGPATHAVALVLFCLMLIPLVVLLYCTKSCKYRNHYCPNCNKKIGYEVPALCIKMTYTK